MLVQGQWWQLARDGGVLDVPDAYPGVEPRGQTDRVGQGQPGDNGRQHRIVCGGSGQGSRPQSCQGELMRRLGDLVADNAERLAEIEVRDNGKSFAAVRVRDNRVHKRLGLLGMMERVEMVGGKFSIESTPGKGTTVRADIPLPASRRGVKE